MQLPGYKVCSSSRCACLSLSGLLGDSRVHYLRDREGEDKDSKEGKSFVLRS